MMKIGSNDRQINILQLWDDYLPTFTGAAIRHNEMSTVLNKEGFTIQALTKKVEGYPVHEEINGVNIFRFQAKGKTRIFQQLYLSIQYCRAVWRRRSFFDVMHSLSVNPFYVPVLLVAKLLGKPVMIDFTLMSGQNLSFFGRVLYGIADYFFKIMDAYVVISTPMKNEVIARRLSEGKCELISIGVDVEIFAPLTSQERLAQRTALGFSEECEVLVFVGSIVKRKGVDILIELVPEIIADYPNVLLILLGQDEFPEHAEAQFQVDEWKTKVATLGLNDHIRFAGIQPYEKVIEYLQAGDVFVFPSRREGLPRVIVEAMSIEIPCVVSELDGVVYDLFEPEVNGIVIQSLVPQDFAIAIKRVLKDKELRMRLGRAAREKIVRDFNERDFVQDYIKLFRRLAK